MSSYRNHRVVIASLFLPSTPILSDSTPPSPDLQPGDRPSPPRLPFGEPSRPPLKSIIDDLKIQSRGVTPIATPGSSEKRDPFAAAGSTTPKGAVTPGGITRLRVPGPLKSIVEDLQDKSRHQTPIPSPGVEPVNPFSIKTAPVSLRVPSPAPQHHSPSRLARRLSRSNSSRTRGPSSQRASHDKNEPVPQWHLEANPHCNGGLHNAIVSVQGRIKKPVWVGAMGTTTDSFGPELRADIEKKLRTVAEAAIPVWIPDAEFSKCYDEFCHQVLWPALHYAVPDAPKTKSFYESSSWAEYQAVNQRFADAIVANYREGDIIWVNDYHLMLLPGLLRKRLPSATIGFFLHVAFPSSEIFRCLSVRAPLLNGILGADLVGFQTASHARHFRQTVSRILSLEATPRGIQGEERFVDVGTFPIGIDVTHHNERKADPEVKEWIDLLKQRYAGFKLVVGRDKLDEVQGVRHKLLAFEHFLGKYPEFQGKVILIQVALQTSEENELQGGVADVISRINSRFSTLTYQPVVFLHTHELTFSQYLALLTVADAFLVTSVREGMALRTHEFVECQEERHRPLILSEFTGSYTYRGFRSCFAINPWDKRGTADAIRQALTISDEEATSRWEDLHNHVVAQSAQAFVTTFLQRCLRANIEHSSGDGTGAEVAALDLPRLLPTYKHSDRRLFLLDFEGTLWLGRDPRATTFDPPQQALDTVRALAHDMRNEVWLLSGLPVKGMLEKVAEALPTIGIVAENGCYIKPRSLNGDAPWVSMIEDFNLSWKEPCMEILRYFTERTPGSFIEEREATIVWRFWTGPNSTADRQWASRQAAEAQNHIFDSIGDRFGLRIIPGKTSFLVLPNNISRSSAVGAILHPAGPLSPRAGGGPGRKPTRRASQVWNVLSGEGDGGESPFDFVFALGQDEKLLRRLNELESAETVSTGEGRASDAKWRVDKNEAAKVLEQFVAQK